MVEQDGPRVILVSGGARGLGAAVVSAVRSQGWLAVALDVSPPDGHDESGADGELDHEVVDVADTEAVQRAVDLVLARHGRLDAVVTCAGIDRPGVLDDVPAEAWEHVVRVNLFGTAAVVRAALPALRRSHGRVVTVASTLGLRALPDASAYCASKFGVVGFTRALMLELAGAVGVTLLVPGGMSTSFFDDRDEQYRPPADAKLNAPQHVAAAVVVALSQPPGCEMREIVMTPSTEPSYP